MSRGESRKSHEEENQGPYFLRHAPCALLYLRGAASNEDPQDWLSNRCHGDGQAARIEAFRQGLRELGYVEGKNIVIEYRYAEGNLDRLPALAAELVRLKVDVIVTGGGPNTRAAKEATNTIPIVMAQDGDPVANGFVTSLARPGGNITGLSNLAPELMGKQLELLKEIIPKLSRVAVLGGTSLHLHRATVERNRTGFQRVQGEGSIPIRTKFQGH